MKKLLFLLCLTLLISLNSYAGRLCIGKWEKGTCKGVYIEWGKDKEATLIGEIAGGKLIVYSADGTAMDNFTVNTDILLPDEFVKEKNLKTPYIKAGTYKFNNGTTALTLAKRSTTFQVEKATLVNEGGYIPTSIDQPMPSPTAVPAFEAPKAIDFNFNF